MSANVASVHLHVPILQKVAAHAAHIVIVTVIRAAVTKEDHLHVTPNLINDSIENRHSLQLSWPVHQLSHSL